MKKSVIVIALCIFSFPMFAQKITKIETDKEKLSYSMGVNIAYSIKQQGLDKDFDSKVFNQAISDALNGNKLIFPEDSIKSFMLKYVEKKKEEYTKQLQEQGEKNKIAGQKFLQENKNKKGVITTASGLQYQILAKGSSKDNPKPSNVVKVKYEGRLLDGTVFDSTEKNNKGEALEIPLNQVIKGWVEGISLMTKGSKYRLFIPSDLAYGDRAASAQIGPNSVLVFDIELLDFKDAPKEDAGVKK